MALIKRVFVKLSFFVICRVRVYIYREFLIQFLIMWQIGEMRQQTPAQETIDRLRAELHRQIDSVIFGAALVRL